MRSQRTDMAARVWQRVQESSPTLQEQQTLQCLVRQLKSDADFLQKQSQQLSSGQPLIKQLAEGLSGQADCLRGIHFFSTGSPMGMLPDGQATSNLKQCYQNTLDRLKEYLLRSADPKFAPVYTRLAEQTRELCQMITQLAGRSVVIKSKVRNTGYKR